MNERAQSRRNFVPISLLALAVAIVTAGVLIANAITASSNQQAIAMQQQTLATQAQTGTIFLAGETARDAAVQTRLNAQHQANLQTLRDAQNR